MHSYSKLKAAVCGFCLLLTLITSISSPVQAQQPQPRFAYVAGVTFESERLYMVDPRSPETTAELLPIKVPDTWQALGHPIISPNGKWGAFFSAASNEDGRIVRLGRLVNFSSGEEQMLPEFGMLLFDSFTGRQGFQNVAWSPDSSYLAINVLFENMPRLLLYSMSEENFIDLGDIEKQHYRVSWSPDSRYLASVSEQCASNGCNLRLEMLDAFENKVVKYYDLRSVTGSASFIMSVGPALCKLVWSPDGRYVAFVSVCDGTAFDRTKEVFLWDTQQDKLTKVTNFTSAYLQADKQSFVFGEYELYWHSDDELVIGASYGGGTDQQIAYSSVQSQSFLFQMLTNTLMPLLIGAIEEFDVNPISGEVALTTLPSSYDAFKSDQIKRPVNLVPSFNGDRLTITNPLAPDGCRLLWSPDGSYLALGLQCDMYIPNRAVEEFAFVRSATKDIVRYVPHVDGRENLQIYPVGWIVTE